MVPLLAVLDMVVIALALFLAYHIRFFSLLTNVVPITKGLPGWPFYLNTLYFIIPLFFFIFFKNNYYSVYFLPMFDELIRDIRSVSLGIFFLVLITFFYRDFSFSRLTFVLFWGISIAMLFLYREILKFVLRYILRPIRGRENILIVGKENQKLRAEIKKYPHIQACYFPFEREEDIEKLREVVLEKGISQVYLLQNNWAENTLMQFYDWCENVRVDLKFVPDISQICKGEVCIDSSLRIPIFHLRSVSLSGFNFYFKRVVDLTVSILVLSFLWPVLLMVAILIKIDSSGPFLYKHKRMGYRGQTFNFYKFRTMVINADELLEKFKSQSERKGPVFKMSNDPRITKLGKFLRRYSIDEILQLLNVLKGEMSLVGPRPQVLWEASAYNDWAKRRLRVLPGITGLWQVSGRASLSYEEMIELDIYYIENWSLGMDINILLSTIPAIFTKKGAC
jgi:exopolysaccharide biosynthesis polyprenyl glycosylphosphotransferase